MAARLPAKPPLGAKHVEERLKLGAGGLQTLALTLLAAVVLAPELDLSLVAPIWATIVADVVVGLAELSAFTLLGYIPVP